MRRARSLRGDRKELNENLAPLRRYLERQVGRPWNKIYSEIAQHLRVSSAVQQHVRDHLRDFVAVKPRRVKSWMSSRTDLWWQPLYVDPITGLLCRTDRLPEEKARRRALRSRLVAPVERVELGQNRELRLISGLWYHVQLAPLPEPAYRVCRQVQTRFCNGYSPTRGTYEVELDVGRLVTPCVTDVVSGRSIAAGPEIDNIENWKAYRSEHSTRLYAIAKRVLSRRELRRYGVRNAPPEKTNSPRLNQ